MTDGTEGLGDLSQLDSLHAAEQTEAVDPGRPEGASDDLPATEQETVEPVVPKLGRDLGNVPEPLRGVWAGLPVELQQKFTDAIVAERTEIKTGLQPKLEERARALDKLKDLEPKAAQLDAILSNEEMVKRLAGLNGDASQAEEVSLADIDLGDEASAIQTFRKKLGIDNLGEVIKRAVSEAVSGTKPVKTEALKDAARAYWSETIQSGVKVTPEVEKAAIQALANQEAKYGRNIRDIPPAEFAERIDPWVQLALAQQGSPSPADQQARQAPGPGATPTGTGARAPTGRPKQPWQRSKSDKDYRPPTLGEIYDKGGSASGDKLDALLSQERQSLNS